MRLCIALLFLFSETFSALALDLTRAVIITEGDSPRIHKAAVMLSEEVEKRTGVQWPIAKQRPAAGESFILLHEKKTDPAEGFTMRAEKDSVSIDGNDERGVMFGVGRLLREF